MQMGQNNFEAIRKYYQLFLVLFLNIKKYYDAYEYFSAILQFMKTKYMP